MLYCGLSLYNVVAKVGIQPKVPSQSSVRHLHGWMHTCLHHASNLFQNCHTLSICCHFVASFYRHVTNIVAEFATSVVLSYHLVAVMWLSYVRQSNYIAKLVTLSQFVNMFCCYVTDVVVELVTHCHCLVTICIWFAQNITNIVALCQFVAVLLHLFTIM